MKKYLYSLLVIGVFLITPLMIRAQESSSQNLIQKLQEKQVFSRFGMPDVDNSPTLRRTMQVEELVESSTDSGSVSTESATPTPMPTEVPQSDTDKPEKKPDHILAVDLQKLEERDVDTILEGIDILKESGIYLDYTHIDKLQKMFIYIYADTDAVKVFAAKVKDLSPIMLAENRIYKSQFTPNDTNFSQQWNLSTISFSNTYGYAVGSAEPVIAVMDNGVHTSDPDLSTQLWENPGETANNGVDDDGNGYIDDVHGCNFAAYNAGNTTTSCRDSALHAESAKHGTYVAAIAAARTNNSHGIAGVCPTCKIMVLDVDDTGGASIDDIIDGINYAVANGAHVINFSYASACPFGAGGDILAASLNSLINTHKIMYVQAAGNQGSLSQSSCFAACGSNSLCSSEARNQAYYYIDGKAVANKVVVASTNQSDQRSSFSNYDGSSNRVITIGAPGDAIPVTYNGTLSYIYGTSFAAPHVAGAIGHALTQILPNRTPDPAYIISQLTSTGKEISTDKYISDRRLNLELFYSTFYGIETSYNTPYINISRFYSPEYRGYFYSASNAEALEVRQKYPDTTWSYQSIAYFAFVSNEADTIPVYRFWSSKYRSHFYTISAAEKDNVVQNLSHDWRFEGTTYYVYPIDYSGDSLPVYRFWSTTLRKHFYTTSTRERDEFINEPANWRFEGVAFRVANI